jgi:hypothetical protein
MWQMKAGAGGPGKPLQLIHESLVVQHRARLFFLDLVSLSS